MPKLAEYIERIEETGPLLLPKLKKLELSSEALYEMEVTAFAWSNEIFRNAK